MESKTLSYLILGFVLLMLGIVFTSVAAEQTLTRTSKTVTSETIDFTNARIGGNANNINNTYYFQLSKGCPYATAWKKDSGCTIEGVTVTNSSGDLLTADTDYEITPNGETCTGNLTGDFRMLNTTTTVALDTNTTTVTYKYCADDYLASTWGRSILNMVSGFMALMCLLGSVFIFYQVYKEVK